MTNMEETNSEVFNTSKNLAKSKFDQQLLNDYFITVDKLVHRSMAIPGACVKSGGLLRSVEEEDSL